MINRLLAQPAFAARPELSGGAPEVEDADAGFLIEAFAAREVVPIALLRDDERLVAVRPAVDLAMLS